MPFPSIHPSLAEALSRRGYAEPTPVQAEVLQTAEASRDLLVSAQTGSGKTVAYGIAIAPTVLGDERTFAAPGDPLALLIAPTRELALQVAAELAWLYEGTGARIVTCVGGMDPRAEKRKLDAGIHIVVGTPGRLRDHLERGALRIAHLQALVLDEADEMLNLGFREDLEFLLEAMPAERRTLLFSATLPKDIVAMARRYQRDAMRIEVVSDAKGHADIEYRAVRIAGNQTEHAIVNVLRATEARSAIVFCRTREAVRHLLSNLQERGFAAVALSGELGQAERNQAMQALRDGRARVCIATDVAARGLDLPSLGLVIHADLPNDAETLQHRSGRTGRAGRKGVSMLLVPFSRRRKAERLLAEAGVETTWSGPPTAEEIYRLDEERLRADPVLDEEPSEDERALAATLLEGRSPESLAVALLRFYRLRLPAPEEVTDPGFRGEAKPRLQPAKPGRREPGAAGRPQHRGPGVWFRMDVGRRNEADPKWILPLLCRRGEVDREAIGAIKIFDRETKFEVSVEAAKRFAAALERNADDEITISAAEDGGGFAKKGGKPRHGEAKPRGDRDRPAKNKPHGGRPNKERRHGQAPAPKARKGDR